MGLVVFRKTVRVFFVVFPDHPDQLKNLYTLYTYRLLPPCACFALHGAAFCAYTARPRSARRSGRSSSERFPAQRGEIVSAHEDGPTGGRRWAMEMGTSTVDGEKTWYHGTMVVYGMPK